MKKRNKTFAMKETSSCEIINQLYLHLFPILYC